MLPQVNVIECKEARYILFNTNDTISNVLYRTGQWDEYLLTVSRFFIDGLDAPIIIDIGANIGAFSIPLAKSIQSKGGTIYGYEPQRTVYYQLCGNIVLNRLENYEALNFAVGDQNGFIDIPYINYDRNHNVGAFSLVKEIREHLNVEKYINYENKINVPMITLDSICIPKSPSLIKIDVEGYELNVLKGGLRFLEQHYFPPLLFEAWGLDWFKNQRYELFEYCKKIGYEITLILGDEYIAQHPANPVLVEFQKKDDGIINMIRLR